MRPVRPAFRAKVSRLRDRYLRLTKLTSALSAIAIFALATGVFVSSSFIDASPAEADSTAAVTVATTQAQKGVATNLGISLSGFSEEEQEGSYQVTVKYVDANDVVQTNGTLAASQSGTSLISGYSSYSSSKLGFKGTYAQVLAALESVTWQPSSVTDGMTLRIGFASVPTGTRYYDANSGHYYEYVSTSATWANAKSLAASKTYFGLNGYLAHITSRAENDFIASETGASNIYIAATDAAVEGQWRWDGAEIAGESDFVFGTYSGSSSTPTSSAPGWGLGSWYSGRYAGWSSGEPNNWSNSEDCAVTNWGSAGRWNDIGCSGSFAYLVEYGGAGGTYTGLALTTDTTLAAYDAKATWTSPSTPTTAITLTFGLSFNQTISGLTASDISNVGSATGCVFSPSASSAAASESVSIVVTECSSGTVQPRLAADSVVAPGGVVIPESTATAVTVNAGPLALAESTFTLSDNLVLIGGSSVTLQFTPRDSFSRLSGPGRSVSVSAPPLSTSVTDNGNGTYTATLSPSTSTGQANISVTVSGTTVSTGLSVSVQAQPSISSISFSAMGTVNQSISTLSFADNTAAPDASYTVTSGALPPGVALGSATGVVSGTPTSTGVFSFVVTATNTHGSSSSKTNTLTIGRAPTFSGGNQSIVTSGTIGGSYSSGVSVASGAYPAVVYSVSTGSLPPGVSLNSQTGALTGTFESYGSYSFAITATNFSGSATTPALSIVVSQPPIMNDNTVLGVTLRGEPYIDGVSATAYPDATYSIARGVLPPGLRLNSVTGDITGTPTNFGTYTFAVGINASGWYTYTTPNFTINVEQAPVVTDGAIAPVALTGTAYADGVKTDALPLATFAVTDGALPAGLTLDGTSGAITGTPTRSGEYTFSITGTNARGNVVIPLTLSVRTVPTTPSVTIQNSVTMGDSISGTATSSGYPSPTFSVASGSLPPGVSINARSGAISGIPSAPGTYSFTVAATNEAGRAASAPVSVAVEVVSDPVTDVAIAVPVGEKAFGAPVEIKSEGLAPSVEYTVTVRSTPQVVDTGMTTADGQVVSDFEIPSNLEPGWHSITLASTAPDGSPVEEKLWFEITDTGILETVSENEPSASEKANATNDDAAFYEAEGIDPAAEVAPAEVASTVQSVSSVVASVALVSAAAAAAAAAAGAAGAAGSAGSAGSAGGSSGGGSASARTSAGGGTNSSGSSGSSGGSSGGGKDGGDGGDDSADYGSMEADHDDFADSGLAWGDRLAWWSSPFMRALDRITFALTESTSKLSPVLSRIINDGSYLRSMLGGLMIFVYIASAVLGAVSVDPTADNIASAGNVAALSVILVLGTLDAFAGLIGIATFTVVSVSMFGITTVGDIRYLVAMFIAGFAPIILATTFRKIRRPKIDSFTTLLDRIIDVFMIAFVASLATLSVVGGISAFAGATVPLADAARGLVFVITGVALIRIFLEELAARYFTERLDAINPTEVPGPGLVQQWVSLLFKYAVLVLMIGDMVGWGWWLWTGAFILFFPGLLSLVLPDLPKSRILTQLIPGGLAALLMATLLTGWSGDAVSAWYANTDLYGPMSFLLVPLPVIAVAIVGMFAAGGDKWYMTRYLKWIYYVGGIFVFSATVWVTDFFGQVFGQ